MHTFVFYDGYYWIPGPHIVPNPTETNARFGASLATLAGTLFVGAPGESAVLVYTRSGDAWQRVQALQGSSTEGFGESVVAAGDLVAVSSASGVDVFRQKGGTWTLDATWHAGSTAPSSTAPLFALDSDRLFVSEVTPPIADDGGGGAADAASGTACSVKVYDSTPGALTLSQSLDYPEDACGVPTAYAVPFAVDGSRLAVGRQHGVGTPSSSAALDIFDQADGGTYALTTSVTNQPLEMWAGWLRLAGNEAVWMTPSAAQMYAGTGASWAPVGAQVPLPPDNQGPTSQSGGFAMTSDTLLVGSPWATNFAELAGTVESFSLSATGGIETNVSWDPSQVLTASEFPLGLAPITQPESLGLGTVLAAGPGIAVVGGNDTGGVAVLEDDQGAWQVAGPLEVTSPGCSFSPFVAVSGQTIALASGASVCLFTRGASGWTESASLSTQNGAITFRWGISFDGKTLAGVCYDASSNATKLCLADTTSATLTLTALPFTGTACGQYVKSLGGDTLLVEAAQCDASNLSQTETLAFQRTSSGWVSAPSLFPDAVAGAMNDVYGVVTDGVTAAIAVDHQTRRGADGHVVLATERRVAKDADRRGEDADGGDPCSSTATSSTSPTCPGRGASAWGATSW